MNTSSAIAQALIEARQHDRLVRARGVRQASAARAATRARRTPAETFARPVQWFRFTERRPALRDAAL